MLVRTQILKTVTFFTGLLVCTGYSYTRVSAPENQTVQVKKELVVIKSTKDLAEALATASQAAEKLAMPLNLRGLLKDGRLGLSHTKEFCEERGWRHPCLTPRGWSDDGVYVSVDRNFYYTAFEKGIYLVVVASGLPGDPMLHDALQKVREVYPDAVSKVTWVTAVGIWKCWPPKK